MVSSETTPRRRLTLLGVGRVSLILATIAVTLGFLYTVIPWYYYYYDARNQIAAVVRNGAVETDEELKRKLVQVAKKAGINSTARDFILSRTDGAITVKMHYSEDCRVTIRDRMVQLFSMGFDISVVVDIK